MAGGVILLRRPFDVVAAGIRLTVGIETVGRSPTCGIVLADPSVSRRHAEISIVASIVTVRDLESRNGTFVDERRIQPCHVYFSQRLRFGGISLWVAMDNSDEGELETRSVSDAMPFLAKDPASITLSNAQRHVFDLLLSGLSEKQIGIRLGISHHTVHNHIRDIYRLVGVHSRSELLARFVSRPTGDTSWRE